MNPTEKYNFLTSFIKLSEDEARDRDILEEFNSMDHIDLYIDADSLVYKSCYAATFQQTSHDEIMHNFTMRVQSLVNEISEQIEPIVNGVYLFFSNSEGCKRRERYPDYKANREPSDVGTIAKRFIKSMDESYMKGYINDHIMCDVNIVTRKGFEADDLIHFYSTMSSKFDSIIVSIDKDLRQISGIHFDYYEKDGKYRGFEYVNEDLANIKYWSQFLIGDSADNIEGVKGIGPKKAFNMLSAVTPRKRANLVMTHYFDSEGFQKEKFEKNKFLLTLGVENLLGNE